MQLVRVILGVIAVGASMASAIAEPPLSPSAAMLRERELQYEQLHQDVASMERELGIYKRVVRLVAPSIVHIEAAQLTRFQSDGEVEEAGAGVIVRIGQRDFVLTNRHVIRHSDKDHIRLELNDGRLLTPTHIYADEETDVALLGTDAGELVAARIGNSDTAEIGDIVMAFGSPFNLRHSVTRGIVSAKGRSNLDLEGGVPYQNFLQTDAAINPGNSGGPLVNLRGEVIGLNTAIASNSGGNDGIGFSIPINIAISVARQLVEIGHVERGFLGVTLDRYFDARAAQRAGLPRLTGARVTQVTESSPAALAGLRTDDVIVRFNGTPIDSDDHLISLVKLSEIGRTVDLVVMRGGQLITAQAEIGRMTPPVATVQASTSGR